MHRQRADPNRARTLLVTKKDAAKDEMTAAIRAVEGCRFAAPVITNAIRMARWLRHSKDRIVQAAQKPPVL